MTNKKREMTSAELKTIRESLGLSTQWVAERAGVQLRTLQFWEGGKNPVPHEVANMIEHIDETIELKVKNALAKIKTGKKRGAEITLFRYHNDEDLWALCEDMSPLPVACHAALQSRLRRALLDAGYRVHLLYMQSDSYYKWLDGRKDTETRRIEWSKTIASVD